MFRCRSLAFLALADIRARHTAICDNHLNSACGFSAVEMPFQHLRILPLILVRLLQSEWVLRQTAEVWCRAFLKSTARYLQAPLLILHSLKHSQRSRCGKAQTSPDSTYRYHSLPLNSKNPTLNLS